MFFVFGLDFAPIVVTNGKASLASNILDVPNFFWDSEPTLHPLYVAIREYLEIDPRIKVLNERCRVFLDLAEILSDSIADSKMSYITWIVIILILASILVTLTEVILRFALLKKNSANAKLAQAYTSISWNGNINPAKVPEILALSPTTASTASTQPREETTAVADLEILALTLGLQSNATLEDIKQGIGHLKAAANFSENCVMGKLSRLSSGELRKKGASADYATR